MNFKEPIVICLNKLHLLLSPAAFLIIGMLILYVRKDKVPLIWLRLGFSIGCYLVVQSAEEITTNILEFAILGSVASACMALAWSDKLAEEMMEAFMGTFSPTEVDPGNEEAARDELARLSRWAAEGRHHKVIRVAERLRYMRRHNPLVLETFIRRARLAIEEEEREEEKLKKGIFKTTIRLDKL